MSEIASAYVSLLPSAKGFGSRLDGTIGPDVERSGRTAGGRFGKVFATASMSPIRAIGTAALALFAVDKVKDFFAGSIDEARESQKVGALTAQVIKSTGHAANVSAAQVGNLSTAISNKVGIDDEAIQSGQNMLLTFKNVRNEAGAGNKIFNQASQTMVDMAASMAAASGGQVDFKSSAIQLGKALNDPVKGITALTKVGVTFDDQQQKTIKTLVAQGKTVDAQKIILKELKSEFGGAAAAQATAGEKMSVAWGNLKEQVGTGLLPLLDGFENVVTTHVIPALSSAVGGIDTFAGRISDAFGVLFGGGGIDKRLDGFADSLDYAFGNTGKLAGPLGVAFGKIADGTSQIIGYITGSLLPALQSFGQVALATFQGQILPALGTAAATFTTVVLPAIAGLVSYVITSLWPAFEGFIQIVATNVVPILTTFATFVYGTLYPAIVQIYTVIAQNLKPVFDQLVATFQANVLPALQQILAKFREWQPTIQRVMAVLLLIVGKLLEFAAAILGKVLPVVIKFDGWLLSKLVPAVLGAIGVLVRIVGAVISVGSAFVNAIHGVAQFVSGVRDKISSVVGVVSKIPGKVVAALGDLGSLLLDSGKALIRGFAQGITNAGKDAYDAAKGVVGKVRNLFPFSPAKEGPFSGKGYTLHSGKKLIRDLAKGIDQGGSAAITSVSNVLDKMHDAITKKTSKATKTLIAGFQKQAAALSKSYSSASDTLSTLQDAFTGIQSAVSSNFVGDLFSGFDSAGSFLSNLFKTKGNLKSLTTAFNKLVGEGIDPKFLSQLFQSGGSDLILSLAAGSKAQAQHAASTFADINTLATNLGAGVAGITPSGDSNLATRIDTTNTKLAHLNKKIDGLAEAVGTAVGKAVNGAATNGKKKNPKGGKK